MVITAILTRAQTLTYTVMGSIIQGPWRDTIDMETTAIGMRVTANSQVHKVPILSTRWVVFRANLSISLMLAVITKNITSGTTVFV
jgi:hypothetical protein